MKKMIDQAGISPRKAMASGKHQRKEQPGAAPSGAYPAEWPKRGLVPPAKPDVAYAGTDIPKSKRHVEYLPNEAGIKARRAEMRDYRRK